MRGLPYIPLTLTIIKVIHSIIMYIYIYGHQDFRHIYKARKKKQPQSSGFFTQNAILTWEILPFSTIFAML